MEAKDAVHIARDYFKEISDPQVKLTTEAVLFEKGVWVVVVSYYENPAGDLILPPKKIFKQIDIDPDKGMALSMKFLDPDRAMS